jgi:glyoxylase-like metal-dependent hydrolase (beta-lactamase superfamily II)
MAPSTPTGDTPSAEMIALGEGVAVWRQHPHRHGRPNAGVVVDDDGITLIDTLLVPSQAQALAESLVGFGTPVRRVVYTSSHAEQVGGSSVFAFAGRYGTPQASLRLDQPANTDALARLYPDVAEEFTEFTTRPVSHMVDAAAWLTERVCMVPTRGASEENLVAFVPSADVVFAGAMCTFGVTPNCFDGDPLAWADALGELAELAGRFVPGLGPVGGPEDLLCLQAYLWACAEANGNLAALAGGPWDDWTDRHLDAINVQRAAMLAAGDPSVPPAMLTMLGLD